MKKIISLFVLLNISILGVGQTDSVPQKQKNIILIKWTPTALIGQYAALQFAVEFYYNPKKSVQFEYGYMFPEIANWNSNNSGHKIRIEQRNYFGKRENWYLAPELHFMYAHYNDAQPFSQNWITDSTTGEKYTFDYYTEKIGTRKLVGSINCKIGYQYVFKKIKMVVDVYAGFGIRYVNTKFTSYPLMGEYVPPKDYWLEAPFQEGNKIWPNGIIGFKIGYQMR